MLFVTFPSDQWNASNGYFDRSKFEESSMYFFSIFFFLFFSFFSFLLYEAYDKRKNWKAVTLQHQDNFSLRWRKKKKKRKTLLTRIFYMSRNIEFNTRINRKIVLFENEWKLVSRCINVLLKSQRSLEESWMSIFESRVQFGQTWRNEKRKRKIDSLKF